MKRKSLCYLILVLFVVVFIACGDSDDEEENLPAKTTTSTTQPGGKEVAEVPKEVNLAAEEAKIKEFIKSYDQAVSNQDLDATMDHWLNGGDVLMVHDFFGGLETAKSLKKIKAFWEAIFEHFGGEKHITTVEKVKIDARGQKAKASGTCHFPLARQPFVAALEKNKQGIWKLQAWDYGDNGLIK